MHYAATFGTILHDSYNKHMSLNFEHVFRIISYINVKTKVFVSYIISKY